MSDPVVAGETRGQRIRRLREQRCGPGCTQAVLAKEAGVSTKLVEKAENDHPVSERYLGYIVGALERRLRERLKSRPHELETALAECGGLAGLPVGSVPRGSETASPPRRRLSLAGYTLVAVASAALGYLGAPRPRPDPVLLTLHCPLEVQTHEHAVFGECADCRSSRIAVFVSPSDNSHGYWRQGADDGVEPTSGGRWQTRARFGNEIIGDSPLPLVFKVFAALAPATVMQDLPGRWGSPQVVAADDASFRGLLSQKGAVAVAGPCWVRRLPGEDCSESPVIVSPARRSLRAAVAVSAPVLLSWTPDAPLWVELWREGREVAPWSGVLTPNGSHLRLERGRYEVKVMRNRGSACRDEMWLDVM
jgi:hypothetical protein